jgi:uncharacterized protein YcfJ
MTMSGDDLYSGAALSGAGSGAVSGAALGSMVAPGWGTAIGAVGGGLVGLFTGGEANSLRSQATKNQQNQMAALVAQLNQTSNADYQQHIDNLNKALSFYAPAQQAWDRVYGAPSTPQAAPQQSTTPMVGSPSWGK